MYAQGLTLTSVAQNSEPTAKKQRKRGAGKPFQKGDDRINRGGRPPGLAALIREEMKDGEALVRRYKAIWEGTATLTVGEPGEERTLRPSFRDILQAGDWLSDHGFGKPTQTHEHTGEGGDALVVRIVTVSTQDGEG